MDNEPAAIPTNVIATLYRIRNQCDGVDPRFDKIKAEIDAVIEPTPATVSEQIEYSDAESVKPVQDFKDAIEKATDPFRDKMNTIKVGDIVTVNFNGSQLTLCFEAEVLYVPCASGDSWHFLDKHSGDIHYVSEGCTVTKRSTPTP